MMCCGIVDDVEFRFVKNGYGRYEKFEVWGFKVCCRVVEVCSFGRYGWNWFKDG